MTPGLSPMPASDLHADSAGIDGTVAGAPVGRR